MMIKFKNMLGSSDAVVNNFYMTCNELCNSKQSKTR